MENWSYFARYYVGVTITLAVSMVIVAGIILHNSNRTTFNVVDIDILTVWEDTLLEQIQGCLWADNRKSGVEIQ